MKPKDYTAQHGIDYFAANKGKTITVQLLSDEGLVFTKHFFGITCLGDHLQLIGSLLIEEPQFNLHMMYEYPDDERLVALSIKSSGD